MKTNKTKKPPKIFAHGAVNPVVIDNDKRRDWCIRFGATVLDEDYPVIFYGEMNIRQLHRWLGKAIDYLEQE